MIRAFFFKTKILSHAIFFSSAYRQNCILSTPKMVGARTFQRKSIYQVWRTFFDCSFWHGKIAKNGLLRCGEMPTKTKTKKNIKNWIFLCYNALKNEVKKFTKKLKKTPRFKKAGCDIKRLFFKVNGKYRNHRIKIMPVGARRNLFLHAKWRVFSPKTVNK